MTVSVYGIIDQVYKMIGRPIDNIPTLIKNCGPEVWDIYAKGLTTTINQADSDYDKQILKKYKPQNLAEMSAYVAAIRPGFASLLNNFIERKPYTTGVKELDDILQDSFHYLMYQESIMKYLVWLGIEEKGTYDIIKKIAKKKFKEEELNALKEKLLTSWEKKIGTKEGFAETWQVIEDAAHYSFNASHSLSVALDSMYGAYLKSHYPLEYFTVTLTMYSGDMDRTANLIAELPFFNIQIHDISFGHSKSGYNMDKSTNTIYKGMESIKYMNASVSDTLYELSQTKKYDNFLELLKDFPGDSRQLDILIKLGYFDCFGTPQTLLSIVDIYNTYSGKKLLKKETCTIPRETVLQFATETEKQYRITDSAAFVSYLCENVKPKEFTLSERLASELEYLGYLSFKSTDARDKYNGYVCSADTKFSPKITVYNLYTGTTETIKCYKKTFAEQPLAKGMIITYYTESKPRSRLNPETKQWEKIPNEFEQWFKWYQIKELPPKETK